MDPGLSLAHRGVALIAAAWLLAGVLAGRMWRSWDTRRSQRRAAEARARWTRLSSCPTSRTRVAPWSGMP